MVVGVFSGWWGLVGKNDVCVVCACVYVRDVLLCVQCGGVRVCVCVN